MINKIIIAAILILLALPLVIAETPLTDLAKMVYENNLALGFSEQEAIAISQGDISIELKPEMNRTAEFNETISDEEQARLDEVQDLKGLLFMGFLALIMFGSVLFLIIKFVMSS